MEWILEILKEYVKNKNINTTEEQIYQTCEYMLKQGYDCSIGVALEALVADSSIKQILLAKEK